VGLEWRGGEVVPLWNAMRACFKEPTRMRKETEAQLASWSSAIVLSKNSAVLFASWYFYVVVLHELIGIGLFMFENLLRGREREKSLPYE
jgi:hypothetical protein